MPPVALVQINAESIRQAGISQINPLDRRYLAQLIDHLVAQQAAIVGIDYILDVPQPGNDAILNQTLQTAIAQRGLWVVFGAQLEANGQEAGMNPATGIADLSWSLQGFTNADLHRLMLLYPREDCRQLCPFSYLLSLLYVASQDSPDLATLPQRQLERSGDLRHHLLDQIDQDKQSDRLQWLQRSRFLPIRVWSYETLNQLWLSPILDFSIPPDRVYDRIAAWGVVDPAVRLPNLPQQIVIIAAGQYDQAGVVEGQGDSFPVPSALRYWRSQVQRNSPASPRPVAVNDPNGSLGITGGEELAYMVHHLLTQRLVLPVPDVWGVGVAAMLGKCVVWLVKRNQRQRQWSRMDQRQTILKLVAATGLYKLIGLQLYISAAILLPWILPIVTFWAYVLSTVGRKTNV